MNASHLHSSARCAAIVIAAFSGLILFATNAAAEPAFSDSMHDAHPQGKVRIFAQSGSTLRDRSDEFAAEIAAERERIAGELGIADPGAITVRVFKSAEDKGLATRSLSDADFDPTTGELRIIAGSDFAGDPSGAIAHALFQRHAGESRAPRWLQDGLIAAFDRARPPHDHPTRLARLIAADLVPTIEDLRDPERYAVVSWRRSLPLAAAMARELIESMPVDSRLALWSVGLPDVADATYLATLRERALARAQPAMPPATQPATQQQLESPQSKSPTPTPPKSHAFQMGWCYAHEGYRIHDGYVSRKSQESLAELKATGAQWISLTPFGFFSGIHSPDMRSVNRMRDHPGGECDEQIIQAFYFAKHLGLQVFLKPHLWGHGGWCGDIEMQNEEDWRRFFTAYDEFVLHYALMAAEYEMPMFSVGNEMAAATRARPAHWRELIAKVRRVYKGVLVYCANWDQEAETLTFWDALDAAACSAYFPLASSARPSADELKAGADAVMTRLAHLADRIDKPVILSELGYAPHTGAWLRPWEENRRAPIDDAAQESCFAAMLAALADAQWCGGVYIWKWPSFIGYAGEGHQGFSPLGKPALGLIQKFFATRASAPR